MHKRLDLLRASVQTKRPYPLRVREYTYALLGDEDCVREWLKKACDECDPWLCVKAEPRLDNLRSDRRFKGLVRRLGLPLYRMLGSIAQQELGRI